MGRFTFSGWTSYSLSPKTMAGPTDAGEMQGTAQPSSGVAAPQAAVLNDPSLAPSGPRGPVLPSKVFVPAAAGVGTQNNMPDFLSQSISDLNVGQQALRLQWLSQLFGGGNRQDSGGYSPAQDRLALAQAQKVESENLLRTRAMADASYNQSKLADLQHERQLAGQNGFGQYEGSKQQKLDQQIQDLQLTQNNHNEYLRQRGWTSF